MFCPICKCTLIIVLTGPSGVGMGQFEWLLLLACIYIGLKIHGDVSTCVLECQVGTKSYASVMVPRCVCVQVWLHTPGVHVCAWRVCVHCVLGKVCLAWSGGAWH